MSYYCNFLFIKYAMLRRRRRYPAFQFQKNHFFLLQRSMHRDLENIVLNGFCNIQKFVKVTCTFFKVRRTDNKQLAYTARYSANMLHLCHRWLLWNRRLRSHIQIIQINLFFTHSKLQTRFSRKMFLTMVEWTKLNKLFYQYGWKYFWHSWIFN